MNGTPDLTKSYTEKEIAHVLGEAAMMTGAAEIIGLLRVAHTLRTAVDVALQLQYGPGVPIPPDALTFPVPQ